MFGESGQLLAALADQAHVWLLRLDGVDCGLLRERYGAMLDAGERARHERFHAERDRDHYLAAHGLLRSSLSRYVPRDPACWTFSTGAHGKPFLVPSQAVPPLCFNLSHTEGLVACVVTLGRECGIDAEVMKLERDIDALAREVFAPTEIAGLERCTAAERADRFFRTWTLKEAYIKATGQGLSAPLRQIAFDIDAPAPRLLSGAPVAAGWTFLASAPTPRHRLAVAVQGLPEHGAIVISELAP